MGTRTLTSITHRVNVQAVVKNTMDDDTTFTAQGQITFDKDLSLTGGAGENQANRGWSTKRTLNSGFSDIIDVFDFGGIDNGAGDGNDIVGQDLELLEIVSITISNENDVDAVGSLEIEPDASRGWTPIGTHTVANGGALNGQGVLHKSNPGLSAFDVTDGSSHRIKLTANGGEVTYRMTVLGRHDDDESSASSAASSQSSSSSSTSSSVSTSSVSSSSSSASSPSSASSISTSSVSSSESSVSSQSDSI